MHLCLEYAGFANRLDFMSGVKALTLEMDDGSCNLRPGLVPHPKIFHSSHRIFGHMHGILNVDKKIN